MYKVVRVLTDGRRVSSFASSALEMEYGDTRHPHLEYHPGRFTTVKKGQTGIFLYDSLPSEYDTDGNVYSGKSGIGCLWTKVVEIYEVSIPKNAKLVRHPFFNGVKLWNMIKLNKKVATYKF
jgi:hypothetical protein